MDAGYFKKIPVWNGSGNCYEVLADKISGRIPVTRIEAWRDFDGVVRGWPNSSRDMVFRGQRRFDWSLDPTLARVSSKGVITQRLADRQLQLFQAAVRGRISDYGLVDDDDRARDELWSVGQHHGLKTPLLDWTASPYVALFFAFFKADPSEEADNNYRVVYALNKEFVANDELCPEIRVLEPKRDDHDRLVNQAGLFTFSPYDSTIEAELANALSDESFPDDELRSASEEEQAGILARYISKIYIKNEDRDGCLQHLRRMNVHHASLFPDLMGASEHCNLLVAEEQKEYEVNLKANEASGSLEVTGRRGIVEGGVTIHAPLIEDGTQLYEEILKEQIGSEDFQQARFRVIAEQIEEAVEKHQVVDWDQRESALARIRNAIRVILRRYGYPADGREAVVEAVEKLTLDYAEEMKTETESQI